ncbi:hypothetical protein A3G67_04375 [Candidatus Roizmanbacteria bacterium RIFCSPLOWO2_12_FULL_40_12]|uniref:RNA helicase n=1 Tax=Candidatus Roizmanbacteria bacterium RIFCSPLOWO2_01_FULL_40_42 TaxID=1802066 RepID=A0A1F7J4T7_9BACT|nr:MAG: hypothetical protein A2779_04775 [Candidatus Roizmanbacteria bacterium RIFCSPHIGHO2_01_FULL_40_98]OGK27385.1 MAG: hypothetical protein A3C31_05100 [Candidatus Roizmanbacteria bacterium RIFCSPHIGHO2_02_FULL_40_53]OGK30742.1 MAG: hypothetical protein A2W49_01940 [Candidatus Roizmanbacteria bacterium RIFCSPHIGHO2_12_41_18]OGK50619.1 MAG: hypothetical protein A3B50_02455 [Candidatus Roizmanbacteria bacterium RIFCSPLOWO2_01_FULL_40_42]OGK58712.1 MAG: hypothetical protein A3H84_02215 [Candida
MRYSNNRSQRTGGGNHFRGGRPGGFKGRSTGGFRGNSNGFRRSPSRAARFSARAFNPSHLVSQATAPQEEKEYVATHSFESLPVNEDLKKNILQKGYTSPTPIQDQTIHKILENKDVIGIANTGTGKTAAFLIPLIDRVLKNRSTKVLIVTPTRELAAQIKEELFEFTKNLRIYSALAIGGVNSRPQIQDLRRDPNFVIGTPGRLKDHVLTHRTLDLSKFTVVVLDEADHMVDMGFIDDIKFLISRTPQSRQSLFFTATIGEKEKEVLKAFVKDPVTISVKTKDTLENISQEVVKTIDRSKKVDQLHDLLNQKNFDKVLIFGRTKWGVQRLSEELIKRGFKAGAIHGNRSQFQRQAILQKFKRDEIQILLATDVAARGLDIDDVSHVINYDMPATYEDYIHRIGRTGRAHKSGTALTFVD